MTGDLGYLNVNNELTIVGRKKNVIIVRGMKIFPEEIENILNSFSSVKESFVYMRKDEFNCEMVIADIVTNKTDFKKSELIDFIQGKLPNYKFPKIINIVQSIEKTANGKILRWFEG